MNVTPGRLAAWLLCAITVLLAMTSPAYAQQSKRVTILKFETFDVDTEVMDLFYKTLNESIAEHPDKEIASGGEVTINEMIVTVGCEGPTPECLIQLKDFVDADQLLFGSVQRSENIHLFTLRLFDFETGQFAAEVEDQTVEGDRSKLEVAIPALVDSVFYGEVGQLEVSLEGAPEAEVLFDGEPRGRAPARLEGLPLGEHVVTVKSPDGEEQSKTVILRRGEPARLMFNLGGASEPESPRGPLVKRPLVIPGWALAGAGLVGIGLGVQQRMELKQLDDAAAAVYSGRPCECAQEDEISDIKARQEDMDRALTRSNIAFTAGAVGLVAGGAILALAYSSEPKGAPAEASRQADRKLRLGLAPARRGGAFTLHFRF